ncbi:hypothetical protein D3C83_326770 [compost metagenome]
MQKCIVGGAAPVCFQRGDQVVESPLRGLDLAHAGCGAFAFLLGRGDPPPPFLFQ